MVPPSLTIDDLGVVWTTVRHRLEQSGIDNRGRIRIGPVSPEARRVLAALLGGPVRATINLAVLEAALVELGVGADLPEALSALGHPVSLEPAARRAARAEQRDARRAARESVAAEWPEPWAGEWIDGVIRSGVLSGLDADAAAGIVRTVRRLVDRIAADADAGRTSSRVDLAAAVAGSSHALDAGSRLEAATTRALAMRSMGEGSAEAWERAGVHTDLVSAPALTWALPVVAASGLHALVAAAAGAEVPVHLSRLALAAHPVVVPAGTDVLVVENPRLVEAAAQRRTAGAVVALNGNPSAAVRLLLEQLLAAGAELRYHGDFDAPGLAICARMQRIGLTPWRMGADDYRSAVEAAAADGVDLPVEDRPVPPTPWDPPLRDELASRGLIVHEERLIDTLLA
ncbi:TIGR02679 family protein [Desertimonas flava]|uniref:TIGR02679 family protein n=1 Tax=Desertimonas flava TaxID=2064846 RepID=UPI0013C4B7E7|nr:TIGR02679 family protein [Desertimonas flava]